MSRNLDTSLIRAFVAVAELASVTTAANTLHLTQAAVSQQIKRLEDAFGCSLFGRDRRGMILTNEGERLLGKAKRLLALNDDIWADMTAPAFKGEVRLGIPYDLVGTFLPPILKAYSSAYPQVEISLACLTSPKLVDALTAGEVDLAVVEEPLGPSAGECLATDRLVWIGAKRGEAYRRRPLPISFCSESCAFRPPMVAALQESNLAWRMVSEIGNLEAISATVQTDLAVSALLASTVPCDVDVLAPDSGLPELPGFAINLHLPRTGTSETAKALAHYIRDGFLGRQRAAA
jgi:DNA-binding transcriptional LysR family regulator